MASLLRTVVVFLGFVCAPVLAQQVDANFQALLAALMQGTPITLLTPRSDGTVEVTSFTAPGQRSAADAAQLIQNARLNLQNLGVVQPTGQQLAAALAGGAIDVPTGRTQIQGVLPQGATGVTVRSQLVNAASLPTIVGASPAGVSAAAGGSVAVTPNGGLAGTVVSPQSPATQTPIVSPLPPTPIPPASTPAPFVR